MSTETTTGGFVGDPAEAFTPPAASGCCGSIPTTTSGAVPAANTCCGSAEDAAAAGACCDPVAKAEAIGAGAGCCG
jgi:hypothetical protein